MLSTIVPVSWSPFGAEDLVASPRHALPQWLLGLASESPGSPFSVARHARTDGAIPLRVGLLFEHEGLLFTEAPVRFCPETGAVLMARSDLAETIARLAAALGHDGLGPLSPLRGGVGDLLALRRVSAEVSRLLGIEPDGVAWGSDSIGVISREPSVVARALGHPEALVFHDDALPEALTLTLEVTTACNFRCGFCYGRHIEQGVLSWDCFLRILDGLPGLRAVEFTGEGEPFVNRRLFDMLEESKRRGLWVHLTTNGSLLDGHGAERIVDLGIESLAVSLESLKQERFARLRPGGSLRVVLDALRLMHRVRRERASPLQLRLWVTLLRETLEELGDFDALACELEIDYLEFQTLNPMPAYTRFYDPLHVSNMLTVDDLRRVLQDRALRPVARQALESLERVYAGRRCDIFMSAAMIYWQGEATPCRLLKVPRHPSVGSMVDKEYPEIWRNELFRHFRFALQHGVVLESCQRCPFVTCA